MSPPLERGPDGRFIKATKQPNIVTKKETIMSDKKVVDTEVVSEDLSFTEKAKAFGEKGKSIALTVWADPNGKKAVVGGAFLLVGLAGYFFGKKRGNTVSKGGE